tara:strand:- start:151 stop:363 length:213 start_codon:yes stop_codon:yes gene_type:complete
MMYKNLDYDKLQKITENAEFAFWEVIAKSYPEIKSGCFPPEAQFALSEALESAVETWVVGNSESDFEWEN